MKKIIFFFCLLCAMLLPQLPASADPNVEIVEGCFDEASNTLRIRVNNVVHNQHGLNVYAYILTVPGIYGGVAPFSAYPDASTTDWWYIYNLTSAGITLPKQECYAVTLAWTPNEAVNWNWQLTEVCNCDEVASCDASFKVTMFSSGPNVPSGAVSVLTNMPTPINGYEQWDMGDGTIITGPPFSYIYSNSGSYTICHYLVNDFGESCTECIDVCVTVAEPKPGGGKLLPEGAESINLIHNGASRSEALQINVLVPTAADIKITDMTGRVVKYLGTIKVEPGQKIPLSTADLAKGIYIITAQTSNGVLTQKMMVR